MTHSCILPPHLTELLPPSGFVNTRVLVVGDVMLDRYIMGEATRISPEAPVPVVVVQKERVTAGGAGNVALNLGGLHVQTVIAGVIANDVAGTLLREVLTKENVDVRNLVEDDRRPTTCKTRVMCGSHQLVRFDSESTSELSQYVSARLRDRVVRVLDEGVHAVVLSDYSKGIFGAALAQSVIRECQRRSIPVFVDPKKIDYSLYAEATCLTPNWKEFQSALQGMSIADHGITSAGQVLREKLRSQMLLVTQGSQGMTLVTRERVQHFPAFAEEVFDVSGAGDTVIATLSAAIAFGLAPVAAVELSNIAASIVVRKVGTVPILWQELRPSPPTGSEGQPEERKAHTLDQALAAPGGTTLDE
ncbi:MAG: D-glycero-beta-D-manno-heptose-7-phosphate kinase [Acidobacteriota bacterium]|nr:D-glycero-beta-D-manno-heptose-7-phosphate kinase [Acidobacteriota bacterium]